MTTSSSIANIILRERSRFLRAIVIPRLFARSPWDVDYGDAVYYLRQRYAYKRRLQLSRDWLAYEGEVIQVNIPDRPKTPT